MEFHFCHKILHPDQQQNIPNDVMLLYVNSTSVVSYNVIVSHDIPSFGEYP